MDFMQLTAQEMVLFSTLVELAKEALEAEKVIKEHFKNSFGIENKNIHVYHTESCGEYYGDGYLNIDGTFFYQDNWWGGREYKFKCDADGIYRMLRSCHMRTNNLKPDPEFKCEIEIDTYFREFIEQIKSN